MDDENVIRDASTFDGGYYIADCYCEKADRPQTVFCDSDSIALGALRSLNDKGIRVPEDVEILTIDMTSSGATSYSMPSLSVIEMPNEEIGKTITHVLSEKIIVGIDEPSHIKIALKLVLRDSFC